MLCRTSISGGHPATAKIQLKANPGELRIWKSSTTEKTGAAPSGLAAPTRSVVLFIDRRNLIFACSCPQQLCEQFLKARRRACACLPARQRRHLYQDKHTPWCHYPRWIQDESIISCMNILSIFMICSCRLHAYVAVKQQNNPIISARPSRLHQSGKMSAPWFQDLSRCFTYQE